MSRRENERRYRERHPDRRARAKKANYDQTREGAHRAHTRWQDWEDRYITQEPRLPDRQLAKILGRSVLAIQVRRTKLRADDA